jgi:hypothetical protein
MKHKNAHPVSVNMFNESSGYEIGAALNGIIAQWCDKLGHT